jgi:hypothetical protein
MFKKLTIFSLFVFLLNCINAGPISSCASQPCKNNAHCLNDFYGVLTPSGYYCYCLAGFVGENCESCTIFKYFWIFLNIKVVLLFFLKLGKIDVINIQTHVQQEEFVVFMQLENLFIPILETMLVFIVVLIEN